MWRGKVFFGRVYAAEMECFVASRIVKKLTGEPFEVCV